MSVCRSRGQELEDAAQVGRKAHVDHAIGLVEHEHLDLVQAHALAALQVEQAAGRGDEQVDAFVAEHALLRSDRHTAEDDADAQVGETRVVAGVGLDLGGQLARRREHERAQTLAAGEQARQHGQDESGRLAGAGLRGADEVTTFEDEREWRGTGWGWAGSSRPRARLGRGMAAGRVRQMASGLLGYACERIIARGAWARRRS